MDSVIKAILVLMAAFLVQYMWQVYRAYHVAEQILEDVEVNDDLSGHTSEFGKPEIIEVTDGVYVAIGFSLANSIMISGPGGLIIVDTTEALETAKDIHAAFRQKLPKEPIKAIIYTHNHADHTFGASVFIEDSDNPPDVWAYHSLPEEISRLSLTGPTVYKRAMRQFGTFLPNFINAGLGIRLKYDKEDQTSGLVMPNKLVGEDEVNATIAGIEMTLLHIPGETSDHLGIWIPGKKIFLCGDDIYKAFPNLYAIRGTPSRDNMEWVNSLDKILNLEPEFLIPSHTRPIVGKDKIQEIVTTYRDAIQFVHDQTIKHINNGLHPTEIAQLVKLPPHVAEHPYLQPFYGTVEWSVKGVFDHYLGWFSGDPVELTPLTPSENALRMINLAGGVSSILEEASQALINKDFQWALQLSSYVFIQDKYNAKAKKIRLEALKSIAIRQTSANGRNYYLTVALEDHDVMELKSKPANMIFRLSLLNLFKSIATRVKVENCGDVDIKGLFNFTDLAEMYMLHMRNGIMETSQVEQDPGTWSFKVTTTENIWKEVLAKLRSPFWALITGDITINGSHLDFKTFFMDCLEKEDY